jgi:hypothetical protein
MLCHLAKFPGMSAYEISPVGHNSLSENQYRDAKDRMNRLCTLKLIQKVSGTGKNSRHRAKYHELSFLGVYYMVSYRIPSPPHIFLKDLLQNYSSHSLFCNFIYPYVKRKTLLKIDDSVVFTRLLSYLEVCCREVEELLHRLKYTDNSKNGFLTEQIFYWKNDPTRLENDDIEKLRKFLVKQFYWKWITKADIVLSNQNNLEISGFRHHALISLNEKENSATLWLNGKKIFQFLVRQADKMFIIEAITKQRLDKLYMKFFRSFQHTRVQELIFSILSAYGTYSAAPTLQILGRDGKFMRSLHDTKEEFDRRYELFTT